MKTFFIHIPPLKCSVYVVLNCSLKQYAKHLKKKFNVVDDFSFLDDADATTNKFDGEPYRTIWLEEFKKTPYWYGVLAHEAVHCAIRICEDKGVPFNSANTADETLAYMVDYLVSEVIKKSK